MKYRKKPVVIEARKFTLGAAHEIATWSQGACLIVNGELTIPTLEGRLTASHGDWIIRGIKGEYYPCKPDIFEKSYESVGQEEE